MAGPTHAELGIPQSLREIMARVPKVESMAEINPEEFTRITRGKLRRMNRKPWRTDYNDNMYVLWADKLAAVPMLEFGEKRGGETISWSAVVLGNDFAIVVSPSSPSETKIFGEVFANSEVSRFEAPIDLATPAMRQARDLARDYFKKKYG